jgi:hypothetical protein
MATSRNFHKTMLKNSLVLIVGLILFIGTFCVSHLSIAQTPSYKLPSIKTEKNPIRFVKADGESFTFLRTGKTTCGKYVLAIIDVPPGSGPNPHIHYSSEEWFLPTSSSITLYAGANQYVYRAGQIPGSNAPKEKFATYELKAGELAYSSVGNLHAFKNKTGKTVQQFINIWAPGDGMVEFISELNQANSNLSNPDSKELTANSSIDPALRVFLTSAKWGVPHSIQFDDFIDGYVDQSPKQLARNTRKLERLLKEGEKCLK